MEKNIFPIRGFNMCESLLRHTPEQLKCFFRRMKSLDFNSVIIHYDYGWRRYQQLILEECQAAGVEITLMTFAPRTFFELVDWTPEWFAKQSDGTPFTERPECETFPCRFAPGALEGFGAGAELWLRSLPSAIKRVHARAGDGQFYCECPGCRELSFIERWQPFVDCFVETAKRCRPDLAIETDVYCFRYDLPNDCSAHAALDRIMFDPFPRAPQFAITDCENAPPVHAELRVALDEWCRKFPGKVYIHENAMKQGFFGVFQHGTRAALRDLDFFAKIGVQGVCYEAYEPGYAAFSSMFEVLSRRMRGEDVPWLEDEAADWCEKNKEYLWGIDPQCDLSQFIADPAELQQAKLIREMYVNGMIPALYRRYAEYMLEHQDKLDWLFGTYTIARRSLISGELHFPGISALAVDFVNRRKLWDFMEDIPMAQNPLDVCRQLVMELIRTVS